MKPCSPGPLVISKELLEEYFEAESDSSENYSINMDDEVDDNLSQSEEIADDDATPTPKYSRGNLSSLNWSVTVANITSSTGLYIRHSNLLNADAGIFAETEIKKGTIFGPYEGVRRFNGNFNSSNGRLWKVFLNKKLHHYIDGGDPQSSNWMRYVNLSGRLGDQNLESFQFGYKIYYRAIVDISEGAELLVWCSENYNQDSLHSGDRNKDFVVNETSLTHHLNVCQDAEKAASNGHASTTTTSGYASTTTTNGHASTTTSNSHASTTTTNGRASTTTTNGHASTTTTNGRASTTTSNGHASTTTSNGRASTTTSNGHASTTTSNGHVSTTTSNGLASTTTSNGHASTTTVVGTTFESSSADIKAIKKYKQNNKAVKSTKSHKCNFCGKMFVSRSELVRHTRTHTGEKPFKCEMCNVAFSQKSHLKQHTRIHTDEKPFKCGRCNVEFEKRYLLIAHTRTH